MRFLINRRVTIGMIFIALTFLGYISYKQLPMELLPVADPPTCSVKVNGSGNYDPTYVEAEIIIPIEGVIAQCSGVQHINSTVNTKGGTINVEFKSNVNIKSAYIRLSELINEYSSNLPDGFTVNSWSAGTQGTMQTDFMTLRVKGDCDVDEILAIAESELETKLANIEGVVDVKIYGGRGKSVEVELMPDLCEALKVTPSKVTQVLNSAGNERSFVGFAKSGNDDNSVFIDGGYTSVEMIGNVVVAPGPIYLRDVATITSSLKEPTSISRLDGERTITVSLANESGANLIELSERTKAEIEELNKIFASQGISIVINSCSADEIESNINQIASLGIVGALLAIVILWFFLHNLRLVLCVALAIPISVFAAFNLFYALGVTINSITLIGITLAVGMLLDNSIVVLENIYRLHSSGYSAEDAVMDGTKQVWRSIFASTLTTVTVFLPFVFTSDADISLMGKNLGVAIISTLAFSLLVALLLIPMLTYVILRSRKGVKNIFSGGISIHDKPIQIYTVLLKSVMRHSSAVLSLTVVALFVSFKWATSRPEQANKSISSDRIVINITMPSENDVLSNDEIVADFEDHLKDLPELKEISSAVYEQNARIFMTMKEGFDKGEKGRVINEIISDVWQKIAPIRKSLTIRIWAGSSTSNNSTGSMNLLSKMGVGENTNQMFIKGADYDLMTQVGDDIKNLITELEYIGNVSMTVQPGANEVQLEMDQYVVNELGITKSAITSSLSGLNKEQDSGAQLKFDDETTTDITITMKEDSTEVDKNLRTMDELRELQVESSSGGYYNLADVAYIYKDKGKGTIQRVDRSRELKLTYSFTLQDLPEDVVESYNTEIDEIIAEYPMPSGVVIERDEGEDDFVDFKFLIFASIMLIFMILASVFESFTMPLVLMCAIPLAAIGSFTALIMTGNSLMNVNTLTGFMILLGVVVNGGIILIDYINILRKNGYSRNRAILMSGASRLRPIMITTITTVIALLPMALGDTEYAGAIGAPFAITVIGGLTFSSLLTLILVPTLYVFLEEGLKWYRSIDRRIYVVHALLMILIIANIVFNVSGVYLQLGYFSLALLLIPVVTYIIMNSIRVANSKIIDSDQPIVIEAQNLVKIYDRPNKFEREWMGLVRRRLSLDINNKYEKLSDLKDLLWQVVLAVTFYLGATSYFINTFWITVMLVLWAVIVIFMWSGFYQYYLNRCDNDPAKFMVVINKGFNFVVGIGGLVTFSLVTDGYGVAGIYFVLIALGYTIYCIARMVERKGINIARVTGKFAPLKVAIYSIATSVPIIGKRHKPFAALKGVSFTINSGMFGLLGPNGAGKSTFMRIVTGIYEPSYGSIFVNGLNTKEYREELQSLIGFLPQEFGTYEYMSAWNFLDYQAVLKGLDDKKLRADRVEYVLKSVHMFEKKDFLISSFSGGMKQRIGIALILLNLPRILVVDEPTAGLDPRERIRFRNLLVELSRDRVVIFSTHIIEDIASSCNQVAVINRGSLKFFGKPNNMLSFAENKVWTFTISEEEFKNVDSAMVANHMKNSDGSVKVRYISKVQPLDGAIAEEASLEDAYLCLLKDL